MNSTICWNCWREELDKKLKEKNQVKNQCVVEIATHILELREMEKEVSAFMQFHHQKYLELASHMGSL
jgi:hypothetical protein